MIRTISKYMEPQWAQRWQSLLQTSLFSVEMEVISQNNTKPLEWKRYIDDTEQSLNGVTKLCDNLGLKHIMGAFESRDFLKPRGLSIGTPGWFFAENLSRKTFAENLSRKTFFKSNCMLINRKSAKST